MGHSCILLGYQEDKNLEVTKTCDLLSVFIAQIDKVQQPCVAVELQALMEKCGKIQKKKESQETYHSNSKLF